MPRNRKVLSHGQTDLQVVTSGRKLNLRRDLRWVAKRTRKFPRKSQVAKKTFLGRLSSISLANNRLMDVIQLALTWFGWPNGDKLPQFDLSASLISTKVSASHRKST